jgi:hypothetical protein
MMTQTNMCDGALSPREIKELEEDADLRLYTCGVCGKRNLYAVKDAAGKWVPEPHQAPVPLERSRA